MLHDPVSACQPLAAGSRVGQALEYAQRKRLSFSLAAFRVDRFDTVESSLGHADIDLLLKELGRRLQQAGRAEDTVAYLGSGAFAALPAPAPSTGSRASAGTAAAMGSRCGSGAVR